MAGARLRMRFPFVRVVSSSRQMSRVTTYTDVIAPAALRISSRGSPANMFCKNLSIGTKIAVVFAVIAAINVIFGLFLASEQRGMRDRVLNFTDSTLLAQGLKYQVWDEPFRTNGSYTELGRNVARINESFNEVATGADHTARACLELSQLAASLRQTIGRFRLA